jgi:hypothetical protein
MDEKEALDSTWSRLRAVLAKVDRADPSAAAKIRLELAGSLDAVTQAAVEPLSPGGVDAPVRGSALDAHWPARNFTPLRDHFTPAVRVAMAERTGTAPSGAGAADRITHIQLAVTPAQGAHKAWEWARREIRAIESGRPDDAAGYWYQSTAFCIGLALAVPARHAPQQFATIDGAIAHATKRVPERGTR